MTQLFYQRNLPHWYPQKTAIFLTWRLFGSLPKGFAEHLQKCGREPRKQFLHAERVLDAASTGPLWLQKRDLAACVVRALERGAQLGCFALRSYVVMPNHVHALLEPFVPLSRITNGIKGASAREANGMLGRTGMPFWQYESFDRWIRDSGEFARVKTYIENNPVKARLCAKPKDWPSSSARKQQPLSAADSDEFE